MSQVWTIFQWRLRADSNRRPAPQDVIEPPLKDGSASGDTHPALESHFLKMPKTIASLALIIRSLVKSSKKNWVVLA